ncbi:hypothetical protein SAMD00024442_20_5 [Candidatus Symbiothrix dinenymphae]|nr:hypothetical protein SAMD00024442_20_5 [Candidatus Symbiothrix dinenymphae]
MKKIYSIISVFLLCSFVALAQTPANRTTKTIVADVLAQMPAERTFQYYAQIKELNTTGEEGVLQLVAMLLPPGKGSNANVEFALSGWANYVTGEGLEAARLTTVNALAKSLDRVTDPYNKAFVISLIEIAGKNEVVAKLTPYLKDASVVVSDAAAKALASINGQTPPKAPLPTKSTQQHERIAALGALMHANPAKASKLLQTALKDGDRKYRCAALTFALDYTDTELFIQVSNCMKKASPELKTDILNWFSIVYDKKLLTIEPFFSNLAFAQLPNKNVDVKNAAIALLAKVDNPESTQYLAKMLSSPDEQDIQLAKEALLTKKGNISDAVASAIATATDAGKIAGLNLLAHRKADKHLDVVLNLTNSGSAEVQAAAYTTLKDVVLAEKKLEFCTAQMNKVGADKRYLYYPLLATTGDPKALAIIVERFAGESGRAKEAAFQALLDWKGIEVADELLAIAKNPNAASYFDKAFAKYVQLISAPGLKGENRRLFLTNALEIAKTDAQKNEILKQIGQTNSFLGLLLAGEQLDKPAVQQAAANAVMNIALNNKNFTGKDVRQLLEKTAKVLNNPDAGYQREAIRTHLNEMPEGEGFVSLFNGKDLTGWKGLVETPIARAKMKPAELAKKQTAANEQMRKDWKVENGLLVFGGTGDNLCTEKQYGDFEMVVDWKLEPSPDADAGIYLRGTPQVQMWNIARTDVGAEVGSGGLYNNQNNPSKPLKVADNKLGEWNTLYIKMTGDRVTVLLNGELVVDNIILENYWDRSQPIFPLEQLELQAHGSKVYYRNIYVKELERPKPFELSAQEKKEGFQMLFDGTNMHEWTGNFADYQLEEGTISVHPSHSFGGNLYTKKEYANFIFRFEFQLTLAANNGVGIRAPMEGDAAYNAMEIQILDCEHPVYKDIAPYQHHGSVYGVIAAEHGAMKPAGEWNEEEIYANGDHIRVTLNGKVILDGNIREAAKNGTLDHKEHPGLFNKSGHIGFLGHGNELKFKNIRIKELK